MNTQPTLEASLGQQRPVICAINSDELAADVLATAAVLTAQLTVPLTVVHSPDPDIFLTGESRRLAVERGNAFLDEISTGHAVDERFVDLGDPALLVTAIAQDGVSMIVIGTRRRSGSRSPLLGSVSRAVVEHAQCPVLVVPSSTHCAARDSRSEADAWSDPVDLAGAARRLVGGAR